MDRIASYERYHSRHRQLVHGQGGSNVSASPREKAFYVPSNSLDCCKIREKRPGEQDLVELGSFRPMMQGQQDGSRLRLAELLGALSLITDLGMGQPAEEAMRACLLATGLARRMDLAETEVADIYYVGLLKYLGCTAYAHEEAVLFGGDDIALRSRGARVDFANPREALPFVLLEPGRHAPLPRRLLIVARGMALGSHFGSRMTASHCEVAAMLARRLGLPQRVQVALYQVMERWDGNGGPQRLAGNDTVLAARFALLASRVVAFARIGGIEGASAMVRDWRNGFFDPELADVFLRFGPELLREIDAADVYRAVVEAEPQPRQQISESHLDSLAETFADMVDLKVPFLRGHSRGVAALAEAAARGSGLAAADVTALHRAALLHDVGRVGVANGTWERPGPLGRGEWEKVRLHPYHSERILSCAPVLEPLASIAGMHHERLDGSGYHRQAKAASLPPAALILAAADAFQAMTQERPYRRALSADAASGELLAEVRHGRHDGEAVQAVLSAAGHAGGSRRREWPAGLTDRQVEVLALLARGASNKQVAKELGISPKTVGHHVQHIYDKIGVSTRAGAAVFAMEHSLLG
ncbi:MAG: HD domain-containing phosphohydrolase [Trueperaceae bacterium]